MDEEINDYIFNDPVDTAVPVAADPLLDLLATAKNKKDKKMKTVKKAFDIGSARATKEFFKQAGLLDALVGAQARDPRKAQMLATLGTVGLGGAAASGLSGKLLNNLIGEGGSQALGGLAGLGALGTAAYLGSTAPGLMSPTTAEQRLSAELAAKLQDPDNLMHALKSTAGIGAAALAAPIAIYQLGKAMGRDESSIF
jgi:hypothetical protein